MRPFSSAKISRAFLLNHSFSAGGRLLSGSLSVSTTFLIRVPRLPNILPTLRTDRGYAERSRRSRVWDPESPVYAGGVGEGHPTSPNAASPRSCDAASPRSCNAGWNEGKERGGTFTIAFPGEMDSTRNRKRKTRNRWRGVAADADRPVEMDWKEVTGRFRGFQVGWERDQPFTFSFCFRKDSPFLRSILEYLGPNLLDVYKLYVQRYWSFQRNTA